MALRTLVVSLTVFAFVGSAEAATRNLCGEFATRLKAGQGDGPAAMLEALDTRRGGRVQVSTKGAEATVEALRALKPTPALQTALDALVADSGSRVVRLYTAGRLGAAVVTAGTLYCEQFVFFEVRNGRADLTPEPADMPGEGGDLCWDHLMRPALIAEAPVLLHVSPTDFGATQTLTVRPILGRGWGATCVVRGRYATGLRIDGTAGAPGAPMDTLAAFARRLATEAETNEAWRNGDAVPADSLPADLRPMADAADLSTLPSFDQTFSYDHFEDRSRRVVTVAGERLVAQLGRGSIGWRIYPGWLVGFWRPVDGRLEPVAGIQLIRERRQVRSVEVLPLATPSASR